jgi:hypothetical protein
MGISLGGCLAPRAAAFEKRISALVANDGIYDYGACNLGPVSAEQRAAAEAMINAPEAPDIDRQIEEAMRTSPTAAWAITHGMFATGTRTPRAYLGEALKYHLRDGIAEQIACPTLVLDAEDDMFFKGQPEDLYNHLTCLKTLIRFTATEGAGAHCQVGAHRLAFGRIYDWLDETLGVSG